MRKETSKAGSVLILRFLHGYYPREIAQVMRVTRPAVEERLRTARSEARQYLKNPNSLHFMRGGSVDKIQIAPMGFGRTTDELLNELRQMIFDSRQGTCLASADLKKLYIGDDVSRLDQATLAHIASCPRCLDEVNCLLNLPLLIERFPRIRSEPTKVQTEVEAGVSAVPLAAHRAERQRVNCGDAESGLRMFLSIGPPNFVSQSTAI